MTDRLSAGDTAFLYAQDAATPMHTGGVVILDPGAGPGPLDYDRLVAHIADRLSLLPRYRQRVRAVPGRLARPVWVDDENFDLTYHVRRAALPKPGNDSQLDELIGRLISRPLATDRPLWEMYLVEGLSGGRLAVVNKTHEAMVDRLGAVDLAAAILDVDADPPPTAADPWIPQPSPSPIDLVVDAVSDLASRPVELVDLARLAVVDLRSTARRAGDLVSGISGIVSRALWPVPQSALGQAGSVQRGFAAFTADLDVFRAIRTAHEGTVNDVVLAVLTSALRSWLLARGEPVTEGTGIRALVPMSVRTAVRGESADAAADGTGSGGAPARSGGTDPAPVTSYLVDLPVAEPSPVMRLHQVAFATRAHSESGRQVGADAIAALGRYTPPTLHALGARVAAGLSRRAYNVLVTNVPGPQNALYVAGAPVTAMFPVAPLVRGHTLAVACTSYHGHVHFGVTADHEAMPDVEQFADLLAESVVELAGTVPTGRPGRSRQRRPSSPRTDGGPVRRQ